MRFFALLPLYVRWHYSQALRNIAAITKNLVWFFWHFFSIGILARTLFMPWQKIHEERPPGLDFGPIFSTWIINGLMRMAGALIRLTMISMGLGLIIVTLAGSVVVYIVWLIYPAAVAFIALVGLIMLLKP